MGRFASIVAKAERLIAEGRVQELPRSRVYEVSGDTGIYIVALAREGAERACTCPATGDCSHIAAALREQLEASEGGGPTRYGIDWFGIRDEAERAALEGPA